MRRLMRAKSMGRTTPRDTRAEGGSLAARGHCHPLASGAPTGGGGRTGCPGGATDVEPTHPQSAAATTRASSHRGLVAPTALDGLRLFSFTPPPSSLVPTTSIASLRQGSRISPGACGGSHPQSRDGPLCTAPGDMPIATTDDGRFALAKPTMAVHDLASWTRAARETDDLVLMRFLGRCSLAKHATRTDGRMATSRGNHRIAASSRGRSLRSLGRFPMDFPGEHAKTRPMSTASTFASFSLAHR